MKKENPGENCISFLSSCNVNNCGDSKTSRTRSISSCCGVMVAHSQQRLNCAHPQGGGRTANLPRLTSSHVFSSLIRVLPFSVLHASLFQSMSYSTLVAIRPSFPLSQASSPRCIPTLEAKAIKLIVPWQRATISDSSSHHHGI